MAILRSKRLKNLTAFVVEKVEKISRTKRIGIFVLTILILAGCFFYLVYMPKKEDARQLQEAVENLERRLKVAKIRAQKIDEFRAEFEQTEKQLKNAMRLLPDKKEIPSLLKSITQLGIDSNLDFVLFMPGSEKPRDFYVEIPVAIEVKGEYREVARFFDKVRQMERVVNIENISMKPEKELSNRLIARCNAVTYRFKLEADEAKEKKGKNEGKRS